MHIKYSRLSMAKIPYFFIEIVLQIVTLKIVTVSDLRTLVTSEIN